MVSGLGLGGAERQVVLLSRELAELGHAVSIYTLNRRTLRLEELAGTGVEVRVDQKRHKLDLALVARLRRHIREWRPDIVHGFLYDAHVYSRLAGWGAGVPVMNSERNDDYRVSLLQRIGYRLTARLCAGVVANSYAGAEFARRLHRLREDAVHVVWNGIDLREIDLRLARGARPAHEIFPQGGVRRICMVGAIKPQKDHPLALRVMRRLLDSDPSWRLICVGDALPRDASGYKSRVLAECARLRLEPFVRFVGRRRDVPEMLASSDLALVTSAHEGFPNVVLEAMSCGVAVASTQYSDVRRILAPGQVAASRDPRDIAGTLAACYRDRSAIARAQRRWVEQHATAAASAAALLGVYARYVGVNGRPALPPCPKGAPPARA